MRRPVLAVGLLLALAACSGGPPRADVVSALGHEAILPLTTEAAASLAALEEGVEAFCSSPDAASQESARQAWQTAKDAWERAEVSIYYGPAPMLRTESKVDFEPVSPEGIDELLASDAVIDVDYVDNRSAASRRGLGAVELGLFVGLDQAGEPRRCELTTASATVAATAAAEMAKAWTEPVEGMEPQIDVFTMTIDPNDALGDVVGAQFEILNRQTLFELGKALGVTSPDPVPDAIPEGPALAGVARYRAQLGGIETTLVAGGESSLLELIRSRSSEVAEQIETRLDAAMARLDSVEGSLTEAVQSDPDSMNVLLDDLTALRDLIHVDVVSLLDLMLGFSDSDGDSG